MAYCCPTWDASASIFTKGKGIWEASSKPLVVGSIDFGTADSGWAFSFLGEFDPTKANVKKWDSGVTSTEKTPTCVLIDPDKRFLAFGYEAEDMYKSLTLEGTHKHYYYFRRFKMMLNKNLGEKLDLNMTLEDEMGRPLPALPVFSMSIKYLVEDMIKSESFRNLRDDDVHWVLTVPAIWSDAAKQFMRLAATEAGICNDRLTIALEPEAASLYSLHLPIGKTVEKSNVPIANFKAGTKYMVIDAGGGIIDITVHEMISDGQVKEVVSASGGGWGSKLVDKAFEDFIKDILKCDVYEIFKKNETGDWLDLWRDFDLKKRFVKPNATDRVSIRFPASLKKIYIKCTGINEQEDFQLTQANEVHVVGDERKFEAEIFQNFFNESIHKTVGQVRNVLKNVQVEAILMVGGFSESPMLQNAIKSEFASEGRDVVIPQDDLSTILRGALIYGHSSKSITERVLKYTYGIEITAPYKEGVHPERHRRTTDTEALCPKHVEKNQIVGVGETQVQQIYTPLYEFAEYLHFNIYASTLKNPKYIDDDCERIGEINIKVVDHSDLDRETKVSLSFSGTEIVVEAQDKQTGANYSANVNFLV